MNGADHLRNALVEEFGNLYEDYGLPRLKGLLVGLLVGHAEPLSLDDMAEKLGRSKGPISQAIRELALAGMVRKATGEQTRRDYYVADPDLFLNNFRRNMRTVARNRSTAEFFLDALGRLEQEPPGVRAQMEKMQAFYALMEGFYARFEAAWDEQKPRP